MEGGGGGGGVRTGRGVGMLADQRGRKDQNRI